MKKSVKMIAAALAAITAMSCTSATAFADLSSDLAAISNQLSDNTNLSKLPIYNLSSNVPIKLNEYTDFSCDMVDCCLVGEEIYHISTMLSFQEKYDEWDKLMQDMRSYTNKKIPINSYEKLRKLKPFGILINVDGKCPGLLYRINDDILICAYYGIKYDNSGNIISLTNDKSMVNYCICNKLSASVLYKNCWYTSATDKDFTVYIGKNGLPVTKNSTIDGVGYIFNKYGKCEGKYTGWAKNSKGKLYYKNGVKVTKNTTIGGVRYKFSSDGYCKGKFTGFTKSSQGRKYWSKGILTKDEWVQDPKGNYYYAGSDGYLLTGWQKVTRIGGTYSYFDENGVWDGKIYTSDSFDSEDQIVLADDDDEMVVEDTSVKEISSYYTDYLVLDDKSVFYSNISNEPSWQGKKWEKSDYIGTIKVITSERVLSQLPSFSASVLPVGTKLYKSTYGGIVILAEVNGRLIPYLKIVEG